MRLNEFSCNNFQIFEKAGRQEFTANVFSNPVAISRIFQKANAEKFRELTTKDNRWRCERCTLTKIHYSEK